MVSKLFIYTMQKQLLYYINFYFLLKKKIGKHIKISDEIDKEIKE